MFRHSQSGQGRPVQRFIAGGGCYDRDVRLSQTAQKDLCAWFQRNFKPVAILNDVQYTLSDFIF